MSWNGFIEALKKLGYDDSPDELIEYAEDDFGCREVMRDTGAWESRWGIGTEVVLEFPAEQPQLTPRYLSVNWERGATEYQDGHPAQTSWTEVYPQEKTVTVFVTKKSEVENETIPLF